MSETLMFPEIDASALTPRPIPTPVAAPAAALAVVKPAGTDLATIDLEAAALARFDSSRTAIAAATKTLTGVVHDLSTSSKLADAKSLRHRLVNIPLAEARKVSTNLKSKLTAVSKAVGVELVAIEAGFEIAAGLITPQIEAREAEIEAERQRAEDERLRKEADAAERREKFEGELAKIRGYGTAAKGLPSPRIAAGIGFVEALAFGPEWEEYASQAAQAQAETLVVLRKLLAETQAAEQAAAAAEALRIENERQAAELAAQQRAMCVMKERMDALTWINGRAAAAQVALIGIEPTRAIEMMQGFIDYLEAIPVGGEQFGDLTTMAGTAKALTLRQLGAMLIEVRDSAEAEQQAKRESEELAAAQAAEAPQIVSDPLPEPEAEKPARDWPDLQTAELAAVDISKIEVFEPTPEQRAERWSPRVEVTFAPMVPSAASLIDVAIPDADDTSDTAEADCVTALLAHIAKAFDCKFPTQPKPGVEWWAELKRLAAEVQA